MTTIQFGWNMTSGPRSASQLPTYVADLQRGLDLITGHFDSAWFVDHLQGNDSYLMEGWTALTYMAALWMSVKYGEKLSRNPV